MGFGGPVWHVSVASIPGSPPIARDKLRRIALVNLVGVGDPDLGQWEEWTGRAHHIRRRMTSEEEKLVGPAVDILGTEEARKRGKAILDLNPPSAIRLMVMEELR